MGRKWASLALGMAATTVLAAGFAPARPLDEPPSIKEVMKTAMKGGLAKTAIAGDATADQKKELLRLMEALAEAKPPRGDLADWEKRTKALVDSSRAILDGKPDASAALKDAVNCKACHDLHKGE